MSESVGGVRAQPDAAQTSFEMDGEAYDNAAAIGSNTEQLVSQPSPRAVAMIRAGVEKAVARGGEDALNKEDDWTFAKIVGFVCGVLPGFVIWVIKECFIPTLQEQAVEDIVEQAKKACVGTESEGPLPLKELQGLYRSIRQEDPPAHWGRSDFQPFMEAVLAVAVNKRLRETDSTIDQIELSSSDLSSAAQARITSVIDSTNGLSSVQAQCVASSGGEDKNKPLPPTTERSPTTRPSIPKYAQAAKDIGQLVGQILERAMGSAGRPPPKPEMTKEEVLQAFNTLQSAVGSDAKQTRLLLQSLLSPPHSPTHLTTLATGLKQFQGAEELRGAANKALVAQIINYQDMFTALDASLPMMMYSIDNIKEILNIPAFADKLGKGELTLGNIRAARPDIDQAISLMDNVKATNHIAALVQPAIDRAALDGLPASRAAMTKEEVVQAFSILQKRAGGDEATARLLLTALSNPPVSNRVMIVLGEGLKKFNNNPEEAPELQGAANQKLLTLVVKQANYQDMFNTLTAVLPGQTPQTIFGMITSTIFASPEAAAKFEKGELTYEDIQAAHPNLFSSSTAAQKHFDGYDTLMQKLSRPLPPFNELMSLGKSNGLWETPPDFMVSLQKKPDEGELDMPRLFNELMRLYLASPSNVNVRGGNSASFLETCSPEEASTLLKKAFNTDDFGKITTICRALSKKMHPDKLKEGERESARPLFDFLTQMYKKADSYEKERKLKIE